MALQTRPPVVTIMGHVDHGKTTLLDYIRHTRVQVKEAGGITQHIGAYQIEHQGQKITFIDTPGHAAFQKMRQRGAETTDIVVLVVAVNDGVKPQTIESIRHIKSSNASIIVAINKTDLPDTYPEMVKGQLAENGIVTTDLGGEVEAVDISAKTGQGVDKLLATITTMAELLELKADPQAPLEAVTIESSLDQYKGPVATVIVQQGTLQVKQDLVAVGEEVGGRVKALYDNQGQRLSQVGPGCPTEVVGLNQVPQVGEVIHQADGDYQSAPQPEAKDDQVDDSTADSDFADWDFETAFADQDKEKIKLIIKTDVQGTLEAVLQNVDEESAEVVSSGVGLVTENDVELAATSGAYIIAFHTKVPKQVKNFAKQQQVKIKEYQIIYQLIEDLQKQLLKLMDRTIDEVQTGEAEILEIFEINGRRIAGCRVVTGEIKKTDRLHLVRDGQIVADPETASMQRGKDEIDRATAKSEFGLTFKVKKLDFQVGDRLTAFHEEE